MWIYVFTIIIIIIKTVLLLKRRNDRRSERNLCNCVKKPEKKNPGLQRVLNPLPRDTGAMLYQLSHEATDVGSWSVVGFVIVLRFIPF